VYVFSDQLDMVAQKKLVNFVHDLMTLYFDFVCRRVQLEVLLCLLCSYCFRTWQCGWCWALFCEAAWLCALVAHSSSSSHMRVMNHNWSATKQRLHPQKKHCFRVTTFQTVWNSLTIPWLFAACLPMLGVTHIVPVLVLLSVGGIGMQQCTAGSLCTCHRASVV